MKQGGGHKMRIVSLVDRQSGAVRSFNANSGKVDEVSNIVRENIAREGRLMTDESRLYWAVGREFASATSASSTAFTNMLAAT